MTRVEGCQLLCLRFFRLAVNSKFEDNKRMKNDFLRKCRLCLVAEENNLLDLFSKEAWDLTIISKINIFCNIIITEGDILPTSICFTCLNEINRFCDFYNRVQENQKLLKVSVPQKAKDEFEVFKISYDDHTQENNEADSESGNSNHDGDPLDFNEEQINEDESKSYPKEAVVLDNEENENASTFVRNTEKDSDTEQSDNEDLAVSVRTEKSTDVENEIVPQSVLKTTLRQIKNKSKLKELLRKYREKSKILILPSQKSQHRISLDEPIREFFDLSCSHCNCVFLTFITMKKHIQNSHNEKGFVVCCSKKLYRREAIMEHINFHLNPNQFKCNICYQTCKSKVTLKVHLKQHLPLKERSFACKTCGQSFVLNSQLKSHEKSHLSNEEKKYVCEECGKAFAFKFVLQKHKQHIHLRQKNYMCEICAKSFVEKVNLTAHKRIHDDTLPRVPCPVCKALLKNKTTLKIHMRTHNPEEHPCQKCDKILSTKSALMNHIQYAHDGKQFPCTVCKKVFKKSLSLKEHMTTHTGEVLYKCQYCDKSFNANANMYAHVKKMHTDQWAEQRKLKWGTVS